MSGMFCDCESLSELDVSGFDTSNVTDMRFMFYYDMELTKMFGLEKNGAQKMRKWKTCFQDAAFQV